MKDQVSLFIRLNLTFETRGAFKPGSSLLLRRPPRLGEAREHLGRERVGALDARVQVGS